MQAGESDALLLARHCTMRPPPGAIPPHSDLISPPHADLITNNSSRGRIGRSTIAAGAMVAAAGAAVVAAAAGAAVVPFAAAFGAAVAGFVAGGAASVLGVTAGVGSAALGPTAGAWMARTAPAHPAERLDMFFCRHCNEASPPGGTLEQCAM